MIIRELGPLLFQIALGDVAVAFDFEFVRKSSFCFSLLFVANVTAMCSCVFSPSVYRLRVRQRLALSYGV